MTANLTDTPLPDDFDSHVEETFDSPHVEYRRMREECPVAWSSAHGWFWALTRFDRENIRQHLGFGRGAHQCAGAGLVRLEMQIMLEELLARTRSMAFDGEMEMPCLPELGPTSTPVRFEAA